MTAADSLLFALAAINISVKDLGWGYRRSSMDALWSMPATSLGHSDRDVQAAQAVDETSFFRVDARPHPAFGNLEDFVFGQATPLGYFARKVIVDAVEPGLKP